MTSFSRHQVIYTDGAWNDRQPHNGGCGFAFFSAARGCWVGTSLSLGEMPSALECELVGILCAVEHCVNDDMGFGGEVELEIRLDCLEAWGRIGTARQGYPLWPGVISTQLINKILLEILVLELRGVAVGFKHVKAHSGIEGNVVADTMAGIGKDASYQYGYDYLDWRQNVEYWSWEDRDIARVQSYDDDDDDDEN